MATQCIEEFWIRMGSKERSDLVRAEGKAILKKLKQRHGCGCDTCRRKWFVSSLAILCLEPVTDHRFRSVCRKFLIPSLISFTYSPVFFNPDPYLFHSSSVPTPCLLMTIGG